MLDSGTDMYLVCGLHSREREETEKEFCRTETAPHQLLFLPLLRLSLHLHGSFCYSESEVKVFQIGIFLSKYILQDDDLSAWVAGIREILLDLATLPAGWLLILTNRDVRSIFTNKKKFLSSQSTF